jgi:hypothetical protein
MPVFGTQRVEFGDRLRELVAGHHRARPAVADPRRALESDVGVAADVERHRPAGRRAHLKPVEIVELAVELDHTAGEDELDDLDHLVDAPATLGVGHSAPLEFLRRPAYSDPESEPVPGQVRDRADLAGQQ